MKRFSVREAIAEAFGLDFSEVENDHRYQPGATYTPCAVYTIGDGYYTATKSATIKPKNGNGFVWSKFTSSAPRDWQIWIAEVVNTAAFVDRVLRN